MPACSLGDILGYFYSPIYTRLAKLVYFGLILPLTMGIFSFSVVPLSIMVAQVAPAVASDDVCAIWAEYNAPLTLNLVIKDLTPSDFT